MYNSERVITDFISKSNLKEIKEFSKDKKTPFLIIDLNKIDKKYDELKKNLPFVKIYYAVKANPQDKIIKLLAKKGSCFDVATIYELDQLLKLKISPDRISFGNTIKKEKDISYAYSKGVRLFVSDSFSDLYKIARSAPGSKVFFRILCDGGSADWPLSRKFGSHPDITFKLIIEAKNLGLTPYGISFHVGSQQRDIGQWDNAISQVKYLFDAAKEQGIELKMINMGGGFPSNYLLPTRNIKTYAQEITRFLKEDFGESLPEIIIEPGRSIVADAGIIVSEVIMVSKKSMCNQYDWVFLDVGKFGGLIETIDESLKYPIFLERENKNVEKKEVILAGPTCDSADILYENFKYSFSSDIKEGDRVFIFTTGAYTQSYSSIYFNGFPPLKLYFLDEK